MRAVGAVLAGLMGLIYPTAGSPLMQPTEGYTYFNKPGADIAAHDAGMAECMNLTELPARRSGDWQIFRANIENCMVFNGWRVFRLPPDQGKALLKLTRPERSAAIAPWVGANDPPGELVRTFTNNGMDPAGAMPKRLGFSYVGRSLSLEAVTQPKASKALQMTPERPMGKAMVTQVQTLPATVPEGMAVIVIALKGKGPAWIHFDREGPDFETAAWRDGKPDILFLGVGDTGGVPATYRVVVPAGRWRVAGVSISFVFNFCLSAPAAEVKPGEVVYLGDFDLTGQTAPPDMSLDPAKAALADSPAMLEKLRPAAWVNGSNERCDFGYSYALEFPGYPSVAPRKAVN